MSGPLIGPLSMALQGLTARGRGLLAAGATSTAAGIVLDQRDLVRVGVLLLALPLTAAIFLARARYRLTAARRLDAGSASAGSVVRVELRIHNVSRLTTPLLLAQDALPPEFGAAPGEGARFVLGRVPPDGRSTISYAVQPTRRGRYAVGPLSLRLADPFGFCQLVRTFAATDRLSVWPAIVPLPAGRLGGRWSAGGEGRRRSMSMTGEQDVTTRPYRSGDDRRSVHWRTTARTGELSVRREEQPWRSSATLLIDTRAAAHSTGTPSASFEVAVTAAASIATALIRSGSGLRLVDDFARIVAEVSHASGPVSYGGTEGAAGFAVMAALADLERSASPTLLPVATRLGSDGPGSEAIIAVLGRLSGDAAAALARSAHPSGRRLALLIDADAWTPGSRSPATGGVMAAREHLRRAGWAVAVAGPLTSLEAAWRELTAVDPLQLRRWAG